MYKCSQANSQGTNAEVNIRRLQEEDQDQQPIIQHLREFSKACLGKGSSPVTKTYWAQKDILPLLDDILLHKLKMANGVRKNWETVVLKMCLPF